tara:strand:+ start:3723 stop:3896 length:174 start_codon:yes stop_codon:yes gene_type:complete
MPKKDKKDKIEEMKEEAPQEEPVPEPVQGRKEKKRIPGIGFVTIVYDNGEFEKVYDE